MELLQIAALLLVLLVALLAGGLWIGITLIACGFAGMQFAGATIPPGPVLATTIWGNSASWTLAALPLFIWMGEILFRTRLSEEMFRGLAPWLNWLPGRLMHVNVLACGIFGSVSGSSAATTRDGRQDRAARTEEARLRPDGEPRLARRSRDARHPHSAIDHDGDLCGAGERLDHPGVPGGLHPRSDRDGAVFRLHRALVARQSEEAAAARAEDAVPREAARSRRS